MTNKPSITLYCNHPAIDINNRNQPKLSKDCRQFLKGNDFGKITNGGWVYVKPRAWRVYKPEYYRRSAHTNMMVTLSFDTIDDLIKFKLFYGGDLVVPTEQA